MIAERYRLEAPLGDGATGSVWRARPVDGGRAVALKLLDPRLTKVEAMRQRFEREARALHGLSHPHLIRFLDYGFDEGDPFLVMELLRGEPLDAVLERGPLAPKLALELGMGIVSGLAHAHAHGVLHRDLKPENVFVAVLPSRYLQPKLIDFGLVRFTDEDRWGSQATLTGDGVVLGTPLYMSPEQGFGQRATTESDVYSAGVLLYELLTGVPPFYHESRALLIRAHNVDPVPPLNASRPELLVREELTHVIEKALAKRPEDRFPTAGRLLHALQSIPRPAAYVG